MCGLSSRKAKPKILVYYASMFIVYKLNNTYYLFFLYRQLKESNPDHKVSTFGLTTSVSVLRKHLYNKNHIEKWVTTCDELKIPITAKSAEEPVRLFRKEPAPSSLESERPTYSKEAFVDAIVEFVVGDDQVCNELFFFAKYLIKM